MSVEDDGNDPEEIGGTDLVLHESALLRFAGTALHPIDTIAPDLDR